MTYADLDELAHAAQSGGDGEMERLLSMLRPVVARWAIVLTGSPDAAEDVAQSVLLRVHRGLAGYAPRGRFAAWVYRITRNVVADQEKRDRRDEARLEVWSRERTTALLGARRDALDLIGAVDQLQRFMTRLPPQQRAVLDLVELQGFSATEAAEMLEVTPATVRVHLHRAKASMGEATLNEEEQRSHG